MYRNSAFWGNRLTLVPLWADGRWLPGLSKVSCEEVEIPRMWQSAVIKNKAATKQNDYIQHQQHWRKHGLKMSDMFWNIEMRLWVKKNHVSVPTVMHWTILLCCNVCCDQLMETVDLNNLRETYLVANDWITRNIVIKKKKAASNKI